MKTLIFDFNGTVVDDVAISLRCLNEIRAYYHNLEPIDIETYRKLFCFPIADYYRKAGFDFKEHSFEEIGQHWHRLYQQYFKEAELFEDVIEVVEKKKKEGYECALISASRQDDLRKQCELLGIGKLFETIRGINNIYATSKAYLAKEYLAEKNRDSVLFIGDTLHDYEVAQQLGYECILVSRGHQDISILKKSGAQIVSALREV